MYYSIYKYHLWNILICFTDKGLSNIVLYDNQDLSDHQENHIYDYLLDNYFNKNHITHFNIDIEGSLFDKQVWRYLLSIPFGETRSYKDVAIGINQPKAYRAVGNSVGRNPLMVLVPCHRIIKSDGSIGGFSSDPNFKKALLAFEKH